jgi:hypothetical protein
MRRKDVIIVSFLSRWENFTGRCSVVVQVNFFFFFGLAESSVIVSIFPTACMGSEEKMDDIRHFLIDRHVTCQIRLQQFKVMRTCSWSGCHVAEIFPAHSGTAQQKARAID